jgi:hypothetical protein
LDSINLDSQAITEHLYVNKVVVLNANHHKRPAYFVNDDYYGGGTLWNSTGHFYLRDQDVDARLCKVGSHIAGVYSRN